MPHQLRHLQFTVIGVVDDDDMKHRVTIGILGILHRHGNHRDQPQDAFQLLADDTLQQIVAPLFCIGHQHPPGNHRTRYIITGPHALGQRFLDALDVPEIARANRDYLRGLYAVIKECDAHIRFSFLTGVSKFSKVSLFSGLNNLTDITLDARYCAICGYTDADLDAVFAPELPGLDRDKIRDWYNGYGWLGDERVYNPFDILLLFDKRKFGAWWFETGTPTFLVETLFKRRVSSLALDEMMGSADLLSTFDVDEVATEALLF